MVSFDEIAVPLGAALASALLVERIVEGGKNLIDLLPKAVPSVAIRPPEEAVEPLQELVDLHVEADQRDAAERAAESSVQQVAEWRVQLAELEQAYQATTDPGVLAELKPQIAELRSKLEAHAQAGEWDERVPTWNCLVAPATDPDDGAMTRALVIQLFAAAVGIVVARYTNLGLFSAMLEPQHIPSALDYLLTGLLIGGGSAPVHLLIRFISDRRCPVETEEVAAPAEATGLALVEVEAPVPPPVAIQPRDWIDVPYEGGIDRDVLEGIHRRGQEPTLIVYHHTAMRHTATMEDLVRVIKARTDGNGHHWVTGYHCVILADGTISPFCRWDRYGNHAAGFNRQSLGVSFMGNFETDSRVPFSNPDGRYGPSQPPELQLIAGARLVALWSLLYRIEPNFTERIIPHRQIANKTCPGGNFPYAVFQDLVRDFQGRWKRDPATLDRIRQFSLKSYLYDQPERNPFREVS